MISSLTGRLEHVSDDRVQLRVGPIVYEAMVPASDVPLLQAGIGEDTTFHTILYFEGDSSGGNIEPKLIGFLRKDDKRFFEKFITVKGIGPKKALKALIYPAGEIAQAIESKDAKFLKQLPQIGNRMAELIVAELSGKVKEFAIPFTNMRPSVPLRTRTGFEEDAIAALMALGERRTDAEHLMDRARQANPAVKTTNELVREMLRMRVTRS